MKMLELRLQNHRTSEPQNLRTSEPQNLRTSSELSADSTSVLFQPYARLYEVESVQPEPDLYFTCKHVSLDRHQFNFLDRADPRRSCSGADFRFYSSARTFGLLSRSCQRNHRTTEPQIHRTTEPQNQPEKSERIHFQR